MWFQFLATALDLATSAKRAFITLSVLFPEVSKLDVWILRDRKPDTFKKHVAWLAFDSEPPRGEDKPNMLCLNTLK